MVYVSIIYKHFQLDRLDDKEIESILYKEWMNHVIIKVNDFPWDILKMLKEKEELIYRQTILDTEIVKVEAQLELVKDVVLREKAF